MSPTLYGLVGVAAVGGLIYGAWRWLHPTETYYYDDGDYEYVEEYQYYEEHEEYWEDR